MTTGRRRHRAPAGRLTGIDNLDRWDDFSAGSEAWLKQLHGWLSEQGYFVQACAAEGARWNSIARESDDDPAGGWAEYAEICEMLLGPDWRHMGGAEDAARIVRRSAA